MHPDTDIHTDFTFGVQIALGKFQQLVADMLDEIDNPALLEPDTDAYRIRTAPSGGRFAVEVDPQLAYGTTQRLAIPFSGSIEQMRLHLAKAQKRLEAVLADLDGAIALLKRSQPMRISSAETRAAPGSASRSPGSSCHRST